MAQISFNDCPYREAIKEDITETKIKIGEVEKEIKEMNAGKTANYKFWLTFILGIIQTIVVFYLLAILKK